MENDLLLNNRNSVKNINDIKNVSGIGDSKYEEIKDYILL